MRIFITNVQSLFLLFFIFNSSTQQDMSIASMEKTEQEALYSVIQGFVGAWWNGSDLYPDPCGWTPIQGISCDLFDEFWYVTVIRIGPIHDNSLECTRNPIFNSRLFELKHLKSLSIFNCFPSARRSIAVPPQNWEKLAGTLETLEFRSNHGLVGEIPATLGRLINLQHLVLVENGLTGKVPPELGNLIKLKRLTLAENHFSGQIPATMGGLTNLLIFDFSNNILSGTLPLTCGGLTSLLKFDLSNNHLDGKLPNELGNLRNLTLLDLRNNRFSGGLTESLADIESLKELLLANNPIGGNLMNIHWENLKNLTIFDFSNMSLTGKIPESIMEIRELRFVGLNNNHLCGSISTRLEHMPSVSAIYLNDNNLTGELTFSDGFYEKMGRKFAVWRNNPSLCYKVGLGNMSHGPFGVHQCGHKVVVSSIDSKYQGG